MAVKTYKERIGDLEKVVTKLNIKMNAIIWLFGLVIALGITNIVMGLR